MSLFRRETASRIFNSKLTDFEIETEHPEAREGRRRDLHAMFQLFQAFMVRENRSGSRPNSRALSILLHFGSNGSNVS